MYEILELKFMNKSMRIRFIKYSPKTEFMSERKVNEKYVLNLHTPNIIQLYFAFSDFNLNNL